MKLFAKICLVMAAVAGSLGIIGIVAGVALGADPEDLRNISLDYYGGYGSKQEYDYTGNQTAEHHSIEVTGQNRTDMGASESGLKLENIESGERFDSSRIRNLELELEGGEVNIYLIGEGEEIICSSNRASKIYKQDGNTLIIEDEGKRQPLELELFLPQAAFSEIDMELGACNVYIEYLEGDEISIELGAGSVTIDTLLAADHAELSVGAGEMAVGYFDGGKLDLDCGVGRLFVVANGKQDDYNYTMNCGIGSVQIGHHQYSGITHQNHHDNHVGKQLEINCGIGEVVVEFPNGNG